MATEKDKKPATPAEKVAKTKVTEKPKTDEVTAELQKHNVDATVIEKIKRDLGAGSVDNLLDLTEEDLIEVGMKKLPARRLVATLKKSETSDASATNASPVSALSLDSILPVVPSDESWLEALRTGGVLKIDQSTAISAVRAALAHRAGLFEIPSGLVTMMEKFADTNEEQVDPEFFKLRKMMTRRSYAEIFAAIDGLDGSYVTEARKQRLLQRIDEFLWPAIVEFYNQLKSWQEAWLQGSGNPALMVNALAMLAGGGAGGAMPPGLMQPPDTGILRDTADATNDKINKVFAGTGVQIASALAYDAAQVKKTLENPRLPALTGAANRDQMLRELGVAVSATYPRLEINVTRFMLGIMCVKDQPAGNEELQYFGALFMLGSQIPWDQLGGHSTVRQSKLSGIGVDRSRSRENF